MAIVKTIDVAIAATTSAFESGMKRSVISFDALAIATKAADAVMAGFRVVVDGVTEAMGRIDTASKAAASIGIATDQLMKLRFALDEIAGVDPTQTDAMLTRMIRNIAEGLPPARYAVENIGLSLGALQKMTPEQAFLTIRDAIAQLPGQGQKAAAAFALFGKQGAALLPVFSGTSEALRESMGFATEFNLAVGSVDAATIEGANDALNRVSVLLEGAYNQIAVELAPAITALALTFVDMAREAWPAIQTLIRGLGWLAEHIDDIGKTLAGFSAKQLPFGNLLAELGLIATTTEGVQESVDKFDFSKGFQKHLEEVKQRMKEMESTTRDAAIGSAPGAEAEAARKKAVADRQKAMAAAQREMERRQKAQQAAQEKAVAEQQRAMEKAAAERQAQIDKLRSRGADIAESVQTPIEKFAVRVAELQRLQRGGFITGETFRRAFGEARQEFTQGLAEDMQPVFDVMKGPAAITGGPLSAEAFSAFQEAQRGVDLQKQQTEYQKRMAANMDVLVRRGIVLAQANLGGTAKT